MRIGASRHWASGVATLVAGVAGVAVVAGVAKGGRAAGGDAPLSVVGTNTSGAPVAATGSLISPTGGWASDDGTTRRNGVCPETCAVANGPVTATGSAAHAGNALRTDNNAARMARLR